MVEGTESARVEQCDRDVAAAYYYSCGGSPKIAREIREGKKDDWFRVKAFARHRIAAIEATTEAAGWRPIETAPKDSTEILIYAHEMILQARYEPGSWTDDTPISPAEYDGPVWCGFDDQINFEIEETEVGDFHGAVTHWMPLPAAPNLEPRHD